MKMHQYNPTAINVFFFSFFYIFFLMFFSPRFPNQTSWLPAGFYASHKWCNCQTDKHKNQSDWRRGRKERKKKGPCHHGFYHVGLLISVWKRGSNPLISLNAPVTPADNSIMIVAIKWDFPSRPADRGRGGAIIPLIFIRSTAFSIMTSGHLIQYTPTPVVLHACSHSTRHLYEANAKFALAKSCVVFIEGL